MRHTTTKRGIGMGIEVIVYAVVMAVAMTVCACLVSLNPTVSHANAFEIVLFVLNFPALIIWAGSGPEHDPSGVIFRIFVFIQWIIIGSGVGFLMAVVRRAMRRA